MVEEEKPLLKPEEFDLLDDEGVVKSFTLSKLDAVTGRRVLTQYPMTAISNNYVENENLMFLLLSFVAVTTKDGRKLRLSTPALVANHVPDTEMLIRLEMKMMEKNFSFFRDGRSLDLLDTIAQMIGKKVLEMLTPLSERSSAQGKPASTTSEQTTT